MVVTLGLLKKINRKLDAAMSVGGSGDGLTDIHIDSSARGTGCIVRYETRDCFVSHWFDDASQMTQCLMYIKKSMKPECTELDLYQFAFSVFNQAPPNGTDAVWLYFLNLSTLFQRIEHIQAIAFWEQLLSGIKHNFRENPAPSDSTIVHSRFKVQVTKHSRMTMVYVGLNGHGLGPNYLTSENGTEFPMLAYKSSPLNDAPHYTYYPAWFQTTDLKWTDRCNGNNLMWIEPAREPCSRTEHAEFNECIQAVLALFVKDTPYTVIGSTLYVCMTLCPRTTSILEFNHRNAGIHQAFTFQENPLPYVINSRDFVRDIAAVEFSLRGYTPVNTETNMECQVALNYKQRLGADNTHYDLRGAADPDFDITRNICYRGTVTKGDFIVMRSTKTEKEHSAANSEPNSGADSETDSDPDN
jgi:hypothetical protein